MSAVPRILIIGAGPCGLGCARELMSLGHENWLVFERASVAGGHAGSVVDPQGFRWDFGGHVESYSSYMTEVFYSRYKPESTEGLAERVEESLRTSGVVAGRPEIASMHVEDLGYAYPVPTIKRDAALTTIQSWLMAHNIYSRGRFGAWKYEIGNMDHSVKMGIDVARFMVKGIPEEVWS